MMEESDETTKLLNNSSSVNGDLEESSITFKAYKRRMYVLVVFSMFSLLQNAIWNTWGPVSDTAQKVFGWSDATLALLPNWGPIMFVICFIPMVNILIRYGLRFATLHCSFLMALGTGVRCISYNNLFRTIACHFCGVLVGYAGTLAMIAPTAVSAFWFPPDERTKSTAFITVVGCNIAMAFSFLVPKYMVPDYNVTKVAGSNNSHDTKFSDMQQDLDNFLYLEFGLCATLFLVVLIYFPRKPPTPPSSSSTIGRIEFVRGTATVIKSWNFWVILLAYALPCGFQNAFVSILNETLRAHNISQETSDWIGLYAALSAIPAGFLFSSLADYKKRLMKPLFIIGTLCAGICYGCFALITLGILPGNKVYIYYIALISGAFFSNAAVPLFYEFSCEISYPVSEEVVTGLMTGGNNFFGCILLGLTMIKQIGTSWVPVALGTSFLSLVPFLISVKANYRRQQVDERSSEYPDEDNRSVNG